MRRSTRALGPVMETYEMYLYSDDQWWEWAHGRPYWAVPGSAVRRMQRAVRFGTGNQIPPLAALLPQPAQPSPAPIRLVARRRAPLRLTPKMRYVLNKLLSEEPAVTKDDIVVAFNKACIRHITRCGGQGHGALRCPVQSSFDESQEEESWRRIRSCAAGVEGDFGGCSGRGEN